MRRWNDPRIVIAVALAVGLGGVARAEYQASSNYSMNESELGAGGDFSGFSSNYSFIPSIDDGGSTLGETGVGNSSSTNYQTNGGLNPTAQPSLSLTVDVTPASLGLLSTSSANTATASFSVSNYTSYGYVVQVVGTPPSYGGHQLAAMTGNAGLGGDASQNGVEQFGMNLVLNHSPANPVVGSADPACQVAGFCFGVAGDGTTAKYATDGRYRYVSGETIASGPKSSGVTNYVITFLANQSTTTPSGAYSGNLAIVATGTY